MIEITTIDQNGTVDGHRPMACIYCGARDRLTTMSAGYGTRGPVYHVVCEPCELECRTCEHCSQVNWQDHWPCPHCGNADEAVCCPVCGNGVPLCGPAASATWVPCEGECAALHAQHGDRADVVYATSRTDDAT